jgi:streptogramin lyase
MSTSMSVRKWVVVIAAGLISAPAPVTEAAPGLGTLKHYRLPTSNSPHDVTDTLDGNVWFTVQGAFDPVTFLTPGSVARVTPRGTITEFAVCDFCITNDIVQGPDGILYISDNDGELRRITTSGEVQSSVQVPPVPPSETGSPLGGVAADSTSIWFADSFNNRIGRFDVFTEAFTFYPVALNDGVDDVAVAGDGTVWFIGSEVTETDVIGVIGEIDPAVGVVSLTPLSGVAAGIAVAPNGTVWATEIFADLIARLTPSSSGPHAVVEFATAEGATPLGIAAAPDGNVWFTQNLRGNIARITQDGVITEASKAIDFADPKRPDPIGIAIAADGKPWYAESLVDKVANLKLR